eukprot:COSAG06_NODE_14221_length_1178_cov_0.947173_2_plen_105_part_00
MLLLPTTVMFFSQLLRSDVAGRGQHVLKLWIRESLQDVIRKDAHALAREIVPVDRRHPVEEERAPTRGGQHRERIICRQTCAHTHVVTNARHGRGDDDERCAHV